MSFKSVISTVMGMFAGLEFILLILLIKQLISPDFSFSNSIIRLPVLLLFFAVITLYRGYLIGDEEKSFSSFQITTMVIVLVIFIVNIFILQI